MEPLDVMIEGQALSSDGFTSYSTVEGLGLNTFGFLWPKPGIWSPVRDPVGTVWIEIGLNPVYLDSLTITGSLTVSS